MKDNVDKIIELKKMLDEKVITQEEFNKMKNDLLENNNVKESKDVTNETMNDSKIIDFLRHWKKGFIGVAIFFIVSIILKRFAEHSFLWEVGTITLGISILLFIVSMISGWYIMHKDKKKWPMWYAIIVGLIIAFIIMNIISYFIESSQQKRYEEARQEVETTLSDNNSSSINFNNPSDIKNGEIIFKEYAKELNCYIQNMDIEYLTTDNNGRYAFKGKVAISFDANSSFSQTETWYVVLNIKDNNEYTFSGAYSFDGVKLASGWNEAETSTNSKYLPVENGITITVISKPNANTYRGFYNMCSNYGEVLEYNWDDNNMALINLRVNEEYLDEICEELEATGQIDQIIK